MTDFAGVLCEVCPGSGGLGSVGVCNGCDRPACRACLVREVIAAGGDGISAYYGDSWDRVHISTADVDVSRLTTGHLKYLGRAAWAKAWADGWCRCVSCRSAAGARAVAAFDG